MCRILNAETEEMGMNFYKTAYRAGAEEYGRARAERYGLWALAWLWLRLCACVGLFLAVVYVWQAGPQ